MTGNTTDGNSEVQWYIARDGQQHGPLTDVEMRLFVESGHIKAADLIWRPGFADWRPAPAVFPPRPVAEPAKPATAAPQPASRPVAPAEPVTASPQTRAPAPAGGLAGRDSATQPSSQSAAPTHPHTATAARTQPAPPTSMAYDPGSDASATANTRSGFGRIALAMFLLAMIFGSIAYVLTHKDQIMQLAGVAKPVSKVPVVKAEPTVTAALQKAPTPPAPKAPPAAATPAAAAAPAPAAPAATPPPAVTAAAAPANTAATTARIDAQYQKSRLWSLLKRDYPDWYGEQLGAAARIIDGKGSDRDATKHMIEQMVALRRKNAETALKAGTPQLKSIATAFLANLQSLSEKSAAACYGFISQGEVSPATIDLFHEPQSAPMLESQAIAIFEAVNAGKSAPASHERPKREDYEVLAAELGKLGWSQADLQLFADPKALGKAEPHRVCAMVRDWFKAHTTISDGAVQERLLFETLRPVVAG